MKTAIVIDDEKNSCEYIEGLLHKYFNDKILTLRIFTNSLEALEYLNTKPVDLVFLDIQMPNLNGVDLLRLTIKKGFQVIFTTAHSEYAITSIKLSAFDYLLKPIEVDIFIESVNRFLKLEVNIIDQITSAKNLSLSIRDDLNRKISINNQTGLEIIYLHDILYALAEENYASIILHNGKHIKVSKPLKWVESQINSDKFFRCHKSFLVNLYYVQRYNKLTQSIELTNGVSISVSERKKEPLFSLLS